MRILLICDPYRYDWYYFLYLSSIKINIDLLWHEKKDDCKINPITDKVKFDRVLFWSDFVNPFSLINNVKPDKIIFFEIIDHRQIALIIAANKLGYETIFLDHGAAGDVNSMIDILKNRNYFKLKIPYFIKRFQYLKYFFRSKYFYYSALFYLTKARSIFPFLLLPLRSLFYTNPTRALIKCEFRERVPNKLILFSEVNMDQFMLQVGKYPDGVVLTGVPYFDKYFRKVTVERDYIIFIDHPYLEDGFLNWTHAFHKQLAYQLFEFSKENQKKIYIKLHPRSNKSLWESYDYDRKLITIVQNEADYTDLLIESQMIIGYSSSLLSGLLCAKKNIVNIGWHPIPQIFGVDFSKTGLCHKSLDMNDLRIKYSYWLENNLVQCSTSEYEDFIRRFNYPFDGKATERVLNAIHNE